MIDARFVWFNQFFFWNLEAVKTSTPAPTSLSASPPLPLSLYLNSTLDLAKAFLEDHQKMEYFAAFNICQIPTIARVSPVVAIVQAHKSPFGWNLFASDDQRWLWNLSTMQSSLVFCFEQTLISQPSCWASRLSIRREKITLMITNHTNPKF